MTVVSIHRPLLLLLRIHAIHAWRQVKSLRHQSRLLTGVLALSVLGYLVLSFWIFSKGLRFVNSFPGLGMVLTDRLIYLLFAFLFAMLLLSNLVISYTNLFQNRETVFLLTLPVPRETILRWKFIESALLASWAFVFLIAPFLAAFGLSREAPWCFYPATLGLTGLFVILPAVAGLWLAIYLARCLDRRSFQAALALSAIAALGGLAWWWRKQSGIIEFTDTRMLDVLDQLLVKTRYAQAAWLPSHWLSTSVLHWADGAVSAAAFFGLVLLSHSTFFGFIALTRLGNAFYDTASAVHSRGNGQSNWTWLMPRRGDGLAAGRAERFLSLIVRGRFDVRALLLKDARVFWRDTTQWGQSVMLFGLLGVYILNLRHFTHQLSGPFWIILVSYLNLGACALNLATLTTRFVYPQFSLEGRRVWLVGMAPLGLVRVVKTKFALAAGASLAATLSLITLSCWLLKMSWDQILFFGAVIAVMTFALNGLAVGLGVLYPNFKECNSSKIVSGFGGTLCLVLSFVYILVSVLLLAFGTGGFHGRTLWGVLSVLVFLGLSVFVGVAPFKLGLRALKDFEF